MRAKKAAGVATDIRPHQIGRHSFGRRHASKGTGFLKRAGGWKSDAAVRVDEHLSDDELSRSVSEVDIGGLSNDDTISIGDARSPRNSK